MRALGNRGSWFAYVENERLPCVHEYWIRDGKYEDPGCMPSVGKWPKFIAAIKDGGRVLVTRSRKQDNPARKSGVSLARTAYIEIKQVTDVVADTHSLRFSIKD